MDITLLRTFLEVAASGSFVASADRLFVTQSAVSLRIQRLEDSLGKPLFTRSKAGAELTPAGREFEHYAQSLIRMWEEARQQVAIPEGFTRSISIGAQYSLWPRLGFRVIDRCRADMPDLNIRAELGMPDRLTRFLIEGVIQFALIYTPQLRPGLASRQILSEELVLVSTEPGQSLETLRNYVFIDWGPEFIGAHAFELPHLTNPGLTLSLGALGAEFIVQRDGAGYLPVRYVKRYLDAGRLHLVPDAPRFPYPVWAIWREDLEPEVRTLVLNSAEQVAKSAEEDAASVIDTLKVISDAKDIPILGQS